MTNTLQDHVQDIIGRVRDIAGLIRVYRQALLKRLFPARVRTVEDLIRFIHTRSAYIAQTSLYGYLKTRMGRQYVKIFRDPTFAPALEQSKWAVFAACLADLSIHTVAILQTRGDLDVQTACDLACHCQRECVVRTFADAYSIPLRDAVIAACHERARQTLWANAAIDSLAFTQSPAALVENAPVIDRYRELDREIVMNSVRFRWVNIRVEFDRLVIVPDILLDWQSRGAIPATDTQTTGGPGGEQIPMRNGSDENRP
ncbi:MAG: hypothetical protein OXC91_08875 [Rhodobacteraceae bacterium]|nr:hypothetical protein [Paracoccaceae bacterium]